MRLLRIIRLTLIFLVVIPLLVGSAVLAWLHFYTGGLPDVAQLKAFAPGAPAVTNFTYCDKQVSTTAISIDQIGDGLRKAVRVAEGEVDRRTWAQRFYADATVNSGYPRYGSYSWRIAGQFSCAQPRPPLMRLLFELRTAIQIERRFSNDEIVTIYLNRAYFGGNLYGVENAAMHFFGRHAGELTIEQSALMAGLPQRPSYLSPEKHPDRALARRNQVIDAMVSRGTLPEQEGEQAKKRPLRLRPRRA